MTSQELISLIKNFLNEEIELEDNTPLIGGLSSIDSMNLVQICLALEEQAEAEGFDFDWRSEKAMSSINSIFKTPQTLAEEYNRQMNLK